MKNTLHYNAMVRSLRSFFQDKKGFIEVPAQSRPSIFATQTAESIGQFAVNNIPFPLPQSNLLCLDYEMLKNPEWKGVYSISTRYQDDSTPEQESTCPIFEFCVPGNCNDLKRFHDELLLFLGFEQSIPLLYEEVCKKYETQSLQAYHKATLAQEISAVITLEDFPSRTFPFWNTKYAGNGVYHKSETLLHGISVITSQEQETNGEKLREGFFSLNQGKYAQSLVARFGKERVNRDLEEYLSLPMLDRFASTIDLSKLANALEMAGIFKKTVEVYSKERVILPHLNI